MALPWPRGPFNAVASAPEVPLTPYRAALDRLIEPLDPEKHAVEKARLLQCKSARDLERLATEGGGWLNPSTQEPRLKLVKHASGTYLVVSYVDGWSTRISMEPIPL